ncbi:hypothetical protein CEE86_12215, partial [Lactobacillus crispatus]
TGIHPGSSSGTGFARKCFDEKKAGARPAFPRPWGAVFRLKRDEFWLNRLGAVLLHLSLVGRGRIAQQSG